MNLGVLRQAERPEKYRNALFLFLFVRKLSDYLNERINVREVLVNGSKTHICNVVELFQTHKHHIAYLACSSFSLHFVCKGVLYIVNKVFHIINTDGTLFDSILNAFYKLLSVKRLKRAVTLVYHKLWLFDHLVSSETLSTFRTLTAATLFSLAWT